MKKCSACSWYMKEEENIICGSCRVVFTIGFLMCIPAILVIVF